MLPGSETSFTTYSNTSRVHFVLIAVLNFVWIDEIMCFENTAPMKSADQALFFSYVFDTIWYFLVERSLHRGYILSFYTIWYFLVSEVYSMDMF